jgi:hypothetical protein
LPSKLIECFFGQPVLKVECFTFCFYEFDSWAGQHESSIVRIVGRLAAGSSHDPAHNDRRPVQYGHQPTRNQPNRLKWFFLDIKLPVEPLEADVEASGGFEQEPVVAANFVFYKIALTRGAEVLVQLLGEVFDGILCSDRCASYLKYHKGEGQFCWAHFKRNILGIQEIGKTSDAERFCRDALALHARLFRLWHRFRDGPGVRYGPITREQLIAKSIPLEKKFFALADRYLDSPDKDVANLALALLQHFERFFAFLRHEGVEPTNNVAERALRCAVQWRKISFGSRSAQGEVAVARLLTVTRTCRMQNRVPLDYLVNAVRSHRNALPIPSLLKTA